MIGRWRPKTLAWAALATIACASTPRPQSLQDAASVSTMQAVQASEDWAPQAYAKAERLLEQAEDAHDAEQLELSSALAQHALAAYQRAQVQARIAKAEQRLADAKRELGGLEQRIGALRAHQEEVASRAEALELKYRVIRDAEPATPVEAADPKREAARRVAARSIIEGARLLCLAARLLEPKTDLSTVTAKMDALEERLEQSPRPTPIDEAAALRSACLEHITQIRSAQLQKTPAQDEGDVLLSRMTTAVGDARVFRDDRGVVVPIERAFDRQGALTPATLSRLEQLADIARANPALPIMVVIHGPPRQTASATVNARRWLSEHGLPEAVVVDAEDQLPASVKPPKGGQSSSRVEFVFVSK